MHRERLTILFSGMIAGDPHHGGATWAVLQYLLGLRELGHDVWFIEPIRKAGVLPAMSGLAQSENANYFRDVCSAYGLSDRAAIVLEGTRQTVGVAHSALVDVASRADLLINVSGMLTDPLLIEPIPVRAYLDLDPAFVQCWHAQGIDMRFGAHTHFVTVGRNIGQASCPVPTCGRQWITTAQPVVLSAWPVAAGPPNIAGLTTIANWRGYGSVMHQGCFYGQKAHSIRKFIDLPTRTTERIMPAIAIHPGETQDLAALHDHGWHLLDPSVVASTPQAYQRFITDSKAELGIAKSGYVESRCGWFSDRSICYLASGRPVIAQDTAFSAWLPAGSGVFAFSDMDTLLSAIDSMNSGYRNHCDAARELANSYFDSRRVLSRLLQALGAAL
jgi:hypothetical protein